MSCRDHSTPAECKDRVLRAHCRSRIPMDFSNNATPRASRNPGAGPHRLPSACVVAGSRQWQVSFRAPALLFTRVQTSASAAGAQHAGARGARAPGVSPHGICDPDSALQVGREHYD